jgi:hypothetical protein
VQRYIPRRDGAALSYREVLKLWRSDEAFRTFFILLLAKSPFAGFRWETPPITSHDSGSVVRVCPAGCAEDRSHAGYAVVRRAVSVGNVAASA